MSVCNGFAPLPSALAEAASAPLAELGMLQALPVDDDVEAAVPPNRLASADRCPEALVTFTFVFVFVLVFDEEARAVVDVCSASFSRWAKLWRM